MPLFFPPPRRRPVLAVCLLVCSLGSVPALGQVSAEAVELYRQVMSGQRQLSELTPEERNAVLYVYELIRSSDCEDCSEECQDAKDNARSAASELASYARRLAACAEAEAFGDDCYTEFRRVKGAHGDYESAVSSVQSECD